MAQLAFGLASFLSPQLFSYLVLNLENFPSSGEANFLIKTLHQVVPSNLPWVSLYWMFAIIALLMVILMATVRFPKVKLKEEEKAGAWSKHV